MMEKIKKKIYKVRLVAPMSWGLPLNYAAAGRRPAVIKIF
jgi:hypothetical protein